MEISFAGKRAIVTGAGKGKKTTTIFKDSVDVWFAAKTQPNALTTSKSTSSFELKLSNIQCVLKEPLS